jgi:hypothetical protein
MQVRTPCGARFPGRALSDQRVAALLAELVPPSTWRCEAQVVLHAPLSTAETVLLPIEGTLEAIDDDSCRARMGGESMAAIALVLGRLALPFSVEEPPELVEEVRLLGERCLQGAAAPGGRGARGRAARA